MLSVIEGELKALRSHCWEQRERHLGAYGVLAHIHTFNDADIIDRTIGGLLRQTRPVDGILVVDNGSADGTVDRPFLVHATVLRHPENRGTSGAVYSGFAFALKHDYDWIWVFDADSIPEPDALGKLLDLYARWSSQQQEQTAFIACIHRNIKDGILQHGYVFTPRGISQLTPTPEERCYSCHVNIWSGCLYRSEAIRHIGLPNPEYVLDFGEGEYGYRILKAGYKAFIYQDAVLNHNIRGYASDAPVEIMRGGKLVRTFNFPPIRCYYSCRNKLYFSIYEMQDRQIWEISRCAFEYYYHATQLVTTSTKPRTAARRLHSRPPGRGHWENYCPILML